MSSVAVLPRRFASLVKIEHTVFALPFAYIGALLCRNEIPSARDLVWITLAMVGARSLAMSINRLADAEIDARNPRTATREVPSGALSRVQVVVFCALALALYLVACFQLDPIVRWLAPVGAWVAITGRLPWEAWALGAAVAVWIAGFDLFYSLFDREIDLQQGLHSVSARFGVEGAFRGARILHALTVVLLAAVGIGLDLTWPYWLGVIAVAVLLAYEHSLIRPGDLRRLDAAFFTVNGLISIVLFAFVLAEATL